MYNYVAKYLYQHCRSLLFAVVCIAMIGASLFQLTVSARPLGCVDHGCTTGNQCVNLHCDVCAADLHCGLITK